ncbi:type IX secretion system membrane protein PorP/SprF, partial [Pedobacter sp. BMA]|uniref:type IX secretion system membrane protein PorP/SprF n=1 Tax=Pedobacter sp. BMA TaxID=1663685 RepID=UPI00064A8700
MRKLLLLVLSPLLLMLRPASAQQDAQYSQYMFNGIYINPAYAGYKEVLNVHSFYRSQWTGITGAP